MRAVQLHEFGSSELLQYEFVDDPEPGPDQVCIKVAAAGVHLLDTVLRSGNTAGPLPLPTLPTVPGREVAGTVDAIGTNVDTSWLDARVVAHLGMASGGYAELAICELDRLHVIERSVHFAEAVAMIGTGRTTMAILELADLKPDDIILVTAATGGIGSLIVQQANRIGATIVATAGGASKTRKAEQLGADVAVDYRVSNWTQVLAESLPKQGISVAFVGVGGDVAREAFALLDDGARYITYGNAGGESFTPAEQELQQRSISMASPLGAYITERPGGVRSLEERALAALASGELTPMVQPFPLSQAAEAHAALEQRLTSGKVVLIP